jgi:hypothetical protein
MPEPLKLDIGCGGRGPRQKGFLGIDVHPKETVQYRPEDYYRIDFVLDALPWNDNTVDECIALHVIEHMMPKDGIVLIQRAMSLLKPGCTLTITTPDLRKIAKAYVDDDNMFMSQRHLRSRVEGQLPNELWPGDTLADRLNVAIHQKGHVWAYDLISLMELAHRAVTNKASVMVSLWQYCSRHPEYKKWWTRPEHETGIVIIK